MEPDRYINILDKIQKEALDLSGLTYERAFALDNTNIASCLDEYAFTRLAEVFYEKVFQDKDPWFRGIFGHSKNYVIVQNLADFLLQRTGGPAFYSNRKGFLSIAEKHMNFKIDERVAERWLDYMEESLYEVKDQIRKEEHRNQLLDFMRFTAYEIIVFSKYRTEIYGLGPFF